MISMMRNKFGPWIVGSIIAVISGVFIFYGIFMPGSSGGAGSPGAAGEVNGETISYTEFSRALNQRVEFFRNMMGGKMSDEQMEQFHIREAVFQDLAQKKLLSQIAKKEGFFPSPDQIREQILGMEVFKKDGRFDKVLYKNVLTQNQYTPTRFEELVGQDIMEQNFRAFISSLAFVGPDEVEKALKTQKEKRKIRYVYLDNESVRKTIPADTSAPIDPKAKDAASKQATKTLEQNKKLDAQVDKIGSQILPLLSANNDAKVDAALKAAGVQSKEVKVKTSDWLSAQSDSIPGVGSIRSIQGQVWSANKGDAAKKYPLMGGTLFAVVSDVEAYDPTKVTAKEKSDTLAKLESQKQSEITSEFTKSLMKKASISRNDKLVVGKQGGSVPLDMDN
jgi:hypothetical protein